MKNKKNSYHSLSLKYQDKAPRLSSFELEAYVKARMPATLAAAKYVLKELHQKLGNSPLSSMLDLGAGPATGLIAAGEIFTDLKTAVLVEKEEQMIAYGKEKSIEEAVEVEWVCEDICSFLERANKQYDLVLFSYSFGEIKESKRQSILKKAWALAKTLVVIEPGTPRGYEGILEARKTLLEEADGTLLAPCPHVGKCPMPLGKWCHFSVRLQRTREHKHLKAGALGWEDEKFSYLIFSKVASARGSQERIVSHPVKHPGYTLFEFCGKNGIEKKAVSKSQLGYKRARKAKWGDELF